MLLVKIQAKELWDEKNQVFISIKEQTLSLEHSLVSISKWESKWHKSFINTKEKTNEETLDYIRCMTITQNVDNIVYKILSQKNIDEVREYIENPMTATWFNDKKDGNQPIKKEVITSELIYYWMISLDIPFECQRWHLNRLLTLIRVCNIKNKSPKKMGKKETLSNNAALNAARKKQLGTSG